MLPKPGITQNLARFVVDTAWEDIPEQARHEAKRALLGVLERILIDILRRDRERYTL